jgi:hypothetical protein
MDSPPLIAFDESGNTSGNLLDPTQPVLVVGSVAISDREAEESIARLRQVTGQPAVHEVHFKQLRSPRGRRGVLALLETDSLGPHSVRAAVAEKRFTCECKLVDLTIEPMWYAVRENLYDRKQALATANLLHFTAPVLADAKAWDRVLRTFNRACADPTVEPFKAFVSAVAAWHQSADQIDRVADMLLDACVYLPGAILDVSKEPIRDPLDPALPLFVLIANAWGEALQSDFSVLHDHSVIIERWTDVLVRLDDLPDLSRPGTRMAPLRIVPGHLDAAADSRHHARLQVADVIVGAIRTWTTQHARGEPLDDWSSHLRELTAPWVIDAIWPDSDFVSSLGGPGHGENYPRE